MKRILSITCIALGTIVLQAGSAAGGGGVVDLRPDLLAPEPNHTPQVYRPNHGLGDPDHGYRPQRREYERQQEHQRRMREKADELRRIVEEHQRRKAEPINRIMNERQRVFRRLGY